MNVRIKKRTYKTILSIILVIFMLSLSIIFFLQRNALYITFKKDATIAFNDSSRKAKDLVKNSNGTIQYPNINVQKLGKQTLVYRIKKNNKTKVVRHQINVVDREKPIINLKEKSVNVAIDTPFYPLLNIESIQDNADGTIRKAKKLSKNRYTISSNVDVTKLNTYTVRIDALDSASNHSTKSYKVNVLTADQMQGENTMQPMQSPMFIKGILIINKMFGIPENYQIDDTQAQNALASLRKAAQQNGFPLALISGKRSYKTQVELYENYVARDGQKAADLYSARPGFSEHQSGLCFDVGSIDNDYGVTPEGKWLMKFCSDYGFIIRYPKAKQHITGYQYEPWHIRYIGKQAAHEIMQKNLTLEEYLGLTS